MAKGQKRSNREAKKPKQAKAAPTIAAPFATRPGGQPAKPARKK